MQSPAGEFHHGLVQVEGGDPLGAEAVEDHLWADPAAAADFQYVPAKQCATCQPAEPRGFAAVLVRSPDRVVHQGALDGVVGLRPRGVAASATMRVLVQRVTSAAVKVDGEVVGAVQPDTQGLLALVGVTGTDDAEKAQRLAEKLWQLRILDEEQSASDIGAPILVVSQFTLYANTAKGRRPTWNAAAPGDVAEPLVTVFADALRRLGAHVETGVFGADMQVELVNDGPVTVLLEL
jgi:D-tyrosyl-tRNA(Tyr) deacylase